MESGPGLIVPVTLLPSQFITNVRWFRVVAFGPQSPPQVPVSGCPSWADTGTIRPRHAMTHPSKQALFNINDPPTLPFQCMLRNISSYESRRNFPACAGIRVTLGPPVG